MMRDPELLKEEYERLKRTAATKAEFSKAVQEIQSAMGNATCEKAEAQGLSTTSLDRENLLGGTWKGLGSGGKASPDPAQKPIQEFGSCRSELSGLGYTLIPVDSIRAIGKIFQEGQIKYKSGAVNARNLTPALGNHSWQYERAEHVVDHLLKFFSGDETEDHLAKVAWFCTIMREIVRKEKEKGLPHAFSASNV